LAVPSFNYLKGIVSVSTGLTLVCPVRGRLKAKARSADGLSPSEERLRVEAIRHLIRSGYPREHIRVEAVIKKFGNSGRNSFRADLAVLDIAVATLPNDDVDALLEHVIVLGEVKRDSNDAATATAYQVKPMLDFAGRDDCVALYWDNVEQRVYWKVQRNGRRVVRDGPLADLPGYGQRPGASRLTFDTIDPDKALLPVFKRVEDILHAASIGPNKRFNVMLQLLLAKLYDEHQHSASPDSPLTLQDFAALDVEPAAALSTFNDLLRHAVRYYRAFLPEPVAEKVSMPGDVLIDVARVLAPIKIVSMKQSVIQDFYMYFAKHIYKWDLAQYFTPTSVTDFVVSVLNPRFSEHIRDPACGSADFLTAAFRRGQHWPDYSSSVWGSDVSPEAVQVAVLNMILNGDGKTNIAREDSLAKIRANAETCDIVVCNPTFGTRITERDKTTLGSFDLGRLWEVTAGDDLVAMTDTLLPQQETGVLFAEVCTRLVRPGGRFAIVVPNGYLGNRSVRYLALREWLLRHCRISAIVGLPRFTFKTSGADVSASIMFCEKRAIPLSKSSDTEEYEFSVEVVDRVGMRVGDKRSEPIFKRDPNDGSFILDENDELIADSDFGVVLDRIRSSTASQHFDWLTEGLQAASEAAGWSVSISDVVHDRYRTLDPKKRSQKFALLRSEIMAVEHFMLRDIVDFIPEGIGPGGLAERPESGRLYRYVEISDVGIGTYRWSSLRGWELPSRARHFAQPGDFYLGSIWSSVKKWYLAGRNCADLVVTNGFHRVRLKPGKEDYITDLVVGLCSESYATQMRGLARGSDGLAEIPEDDAATVLLPRVLDETIRREMQPFVDQLLAGMTSVESKVAAMTAEGTLIVPTPPERPDHTALL